MYHEGEKYIMGFPKLKNMVTLYKFVGVVQIAYTVPLKSNRKIIFRKEIACNSYKSYIIIKIY